SLVYGSTGSAKRPSPSLRESFATSAGFPRRSMSSSPPEGLARRALTREDAGVAAALLDDDEILLGAPPRLEAQDVLDWWGRTDLGQDSWLFENEERAVAVGWLEDQGDTV